MNRTCVVFLLAACLLAGFGMFAANAEETAGDIPGFFSPESETTHIIYVSPNGDDEDSGSFESPVQTVIKALQLAGEAQGVEEVVISFRGGTYIFENTITLTGDPGKRVTLRAYSGETVVFTGAVPVYGLRETTYMDQTVWTVPTDKAEIRAVYAQNGQRNITRWPQAGMLSVRKGETTSDDKFLNQRSFYMNTEQMPSALSLRNATVRVLHWWKDELSGLAAYDENGGMVTMNRPSAMTIAAGDDVWFENVLNMPMQPGSWAHDSERGVLYYAPREGEVIGNTRLYVGQTEILFYLRGVNNITFDRITFARNNWTIPFDDKQADFPQAAYDAKAAVVVLDGQNISFTSCTFEDIGSGCIFFGSVVKDATVFNCEFRNIGAQAINIQGTNTDADAYINERILIENNEISGYGRNFYNAAAILVIHAREVDICFNEIHDGTYTAISAGWVWLETYNVTDHVLIRNNNIHNIGQGKLSDMGAIYLLGAQPNTVVYGNIIRDVVSSVYGGWGIYLDESTSGITVLENLVYRCSAQGFHQHGGISNTVTNNIFALNEDGQVGASGSGTVRLERNLLVGDKYLNIINDVTVRQKDNIKLSDASIFRDPDNGDFTIVDEQQVRSLGFVPWIVYAGRY